jgi:hypothetical protein
MDLLKQRQLYGWVIGILVVLNLLSITVVWVQSEQGRPAPPRSGGNPSAISVELMQQELGLSPEQTKQYQQLRVEQQEGLRKINNELDELKLRVVNEIFESRSDHAQIDSMVSRIGMLQSRLEMLRFAHFRSFAEICDSGQRERLRPILESVFSRRGRDVKPSGPTQAGDDLRGGGNAREEKRSQKNDQRPEMRPEQKEKKESAPQSGKVDQRRPQRPEERPAPPSFEEKLERFVQRLSLTPDQAKSVGEFMKATRAKEEDYKVKLDPTAADFEREKQRLRDIEDKSIMQILKEKQKREFEKMVKNRGNAGRN